MTFFYSERPLPGSGGGLFLQYEKHADSSTWKGDIEGADTSGLGTE
jgi:hypothetical protein